MQKLFIVCLPELIDGWREDPFWEFGSFGRDPKFRPSFLTNDNCPVQRDWLVAFAQEGPLGTRLLYVTPPVDVVQHRRFREIRWQAGEPFKYAETAPLLIDHTGLSHFPKFRELIKDARPKPWIKRCRATCRKQSWDLDSKVAVEIIDSFGKAIASPFVEIAEDFRDTVPLRPEHIKLIGGYGVDDTSRWKRYGSLSKPFETTVVN